MKNQTLSKETQLQVRILLQSWLTVGEMMLIPYVSLLIAHWLFGVTFHEIGLLAMQMAFAGSGYMVATPLARFTLQSEIGATMRTTHYVAMFVGLAMFTHSWYFLWCADKLFGGTLCIAIPPVMIFGVMFFKTKNQKQPQVG